MTHSRSFLLLGITTLILAACGSVREDLGIGRNPPDEFAVIERPPLSMPPDFGLHPPRPGAPRPQTVDTAAQAKDTLFNGAGFNGNIGASTKASSQGERALLEAAGATKADSTIRDTVDHEAAQKVVASPHLVEKLMSSSSDEKPAATVDAAAESARIRKAQQDNQPVTTGATPVIEKQESGWLGL